MSWTGSIEIYSSVVRVETRPVSTVGSRFDDNLFVTGFDWDWLHTIVENSVEIMFMAIQSLLLI